MRKRAANFGYRRERLTGWWWDDETARLAAAGLPAAMIMTVRRERQRARFWNIFAIKFVTARHFLDEAVWQHSAIARPAAPFLTKRIAQRVIGDPLFFGVRLRRAHVELHE